MIKIGLTNGFWICAILKVLRNSKDAINLKKFNFWKQFTEHWFPNCLLSTERLKAGNWAIKYVEKKQNNL